MAELQTYLTGIADAIRSKKGTTAPINAKDFASEIRSIAGSGGSGGSVEVPPVTNLAVDENYNLTFTKPDVSNLLEQGAVISYIVKINEEIIEIEDSGVNIAGYLNNGLNNVTVYVKVAYLSEGNIIEVISETIAILATKLPEPMNSLSIASVDKNIYLFGGYNGSNSLNIIQKFDSTSETITTLSVKLPNKMTKMSPASVGNNIYLFGGSKQDGYFENILKFDSTSETITTLSVKLPTAVYDAGSASVDNNVYLFGGSAVFDGGNRVDTIQKFDSTSETITTLSVKLLEPINYIRVASVDKNIYLFGGSNGSGNRVDTIQKFDSTSGTITTLATKLPEPMNSFGIASVDKNIYLFGGYNGSGSKVDIIQKFNTNDNTLTTLNVKLLEATADINASSVGNNIYLFGGFGGSRLDTIQKFSC